LAALFASLTAAGAFVALPMVGPVPFTLQVFFVLLAGFVLGPRLGALSMIMYLLLGLVAPVYAGGLSGIAALVGPTGGYLVGFVLSPLVTGLARQRLPMRGTLSLLVSGLARRRLPMRGTLSLFAIGAAALLPIYGLGAAWLAVSLRSASYHVILWGGVLQFVPLDLVKALAAALTARALLSLPLGLPEPQRSR
jgi:biotin transport system substrate-specific component